MQYPHVEQWDDLGGRQMLHVVQYLSIEPSFCFRCHCPFQSRLYL